MEQRVIDRYRHVKTLAERGGTEGERAAARAAMERMERIHPGIAAASAANANPGPTVDGSFGFPPGGFQSSGRAAPPRGNAAWDSVFDFLRNAAEGLRDGVNLRERIEEVTTLDTTVNTRTMKISLSIPISDFDELLDEFGEDKLPEMATILSSMFRDEFLATVDSMGVEEED
jgi:hypothetical protein